MLPLCDVKSQWIVNRHAYIPIRTLYYFFITYTWGLACTQHHHIKGKYNDLEDMVMWWQFVYVFVASGVLTTVSLTLTNAVVTTMATAISDGV